MTTAPTELHQTFDPALPIDQIRPNPNNPNEGDQATLEESIETLGFFGAILVRQVDEWEFELIGGEHRVRDRKARGIPTIPALIVHDVDDEHALKMLLSDNEVTRRGQNNVAKLNKVLRSLENTRGTGFPADVLAQLEAHEHERAKGARHASVPDREAAPKEFAREYGIVITCSDETHQEELYNKLLETLELDPEKLRAVSI